jgi:hypothetical protein
LKLILIKETPTVCPDVPVAMSEATVTITLCPAGIVKIP